LLARLRVCVLTTQPAVALSFLARQRDRDRGGERDRAKQRADLLKLLRQQAHATATSTTAGSVNTNQ
jgi:site-specific recombinase